MAVKKARVLTAITLQDGSTLMPGSIVEAEKATLDSFGDAIDTSPEAVAYCVAQGATPVRIGKDAPAADPTPPEPAPV